MSFSWVTDAGRPGRTSCSGSIGPGGIVRRSQASAMPDSWRPALPTGVSTVIIVDNPGRDRFYLFCRETTWAAPRLIRAWGRRSWIEHSFRTLKHLLATEACQVQDEDAYYGHLVLRLLAGLVLLYTARVLCKGRVTMEAECVPHTQPLKLDTASGIGNIFS